MFRVNHSYKGFFTCEENLNKMSFIDTDDDEYVKIQKDDMECKDEDTYQIVHDCICLSNIISRFKLECTYFYQPRKQEILPILNIFESIKGNHSSLSKNQEYNTLIEKVSSVISYLKDLESQDTIDKTILSTSLNEITTCCQCIRESFKHKMM